MEHVDLRSKGFFGIIGFSIRLIHSRRLLFLLLAACILLPVASLSLASFRLANRIYANNNNSNLVYVPSTTNSSEVLVFSMPSTTSRSEQSVSVLLFSIIYLLDLLLATGAIIHAATSAYASKESASFRKSLFRAAWRMWPRLLWTSICAALITLVYLLLGALIFGLTVELAKAAVNAAVILRVLAIILACVVGAVFIAGALYITILGYLAAAATIIERATVSGGTCWGFAAIKKARALVSGRVIMCCALVLVFQLLYFGVQVCWAIVLAAYYAPLAGRIAAGIVILLGLAGLLLLGLTCLAVAYLVLKAWHGEAVDPVSLASSLDACAGEYERMVPNGGAAGNFPHQMV